MKDKFTIVQNFICTKPLRLRRILEEVPKLAKIFKGVKFIVNYNTLTNSKIIEECYRKHVDNLDFRITVEKGWLTQELHLVQSVITPYIIHFAEDIVIGGSSEEWKELWQEIEEQKVDFLNLTKLFKYSSMRRGYTSGKNLNFYNARNAPGHVLSIQAAIRKELFVERLLECLEGGDHRTPVGYEKFYFENNGIRKFNFRCAVPKNPNIVTHAHPGGQNEPG